MAEDLAKLLEQQGEIESQIYEKSVELKQPLYTARREVVKGIERFWSQVIDESGLLAEYIEYDDTQVTDALKELWIEYDQSNVRQCTLVFEFGPNPCLESVAIRKPFKYDNDKRCYVSEKVSLPWKAGHDLVKQSKGSFFAWFAYEGPQGPLAKLSPIADTIIEEIYPNALEYYRASQEDENIVDPYDISETDEEEVSDNSADDDNDKNDKSGLEPEPKKPKLQQ